MYSKSTNRVPKNKKLKGKISLLSAKRFTNLKEINGSKCSGL